MKIVIIGGGFAGINLAKSLANNKDFQIVLVDKNNYNFFPPLIYQVATAFLEPSSISYPFRKLFSGKKNITFRLAELIRVDASNNKVILSNGELEYDQLVFSTGAESNYFGMENVRKNAIPMKTLNDAVEMRNRLLQQMEKAAICEDPRRRRQLLTIVVAGGGPTGVELSGMFAEMRNGIMRKEYPELANTLSDIYLVDGGSAVLAPMSVNSQQNTYKALTKLGVKVRLNSQVKDYSDGTVYFADGKTIKTEILIWAAGVSAKLFDGIPEDVYGRGRRMQVDEHNKIKGFTNIYAVGDTCLQVTDPKFPNGHPQLAQVAIQQARHLAQNFKAMVTNKPLTPFSYNDKGSMAIIGKNKAVVDLEKPKVHFNGFFAWLVWLFIHLMSLVTYRNRLQTLYNWTVAYFSKDQPLRMIIRPGKNDDTSS